MVSKKVIHCSLSRLKCLNLLVLSTKDGQKFITKEKSMHIYTSLKSTKKNVTSKTVYARQDFAPRQATGFITSQAHI